MIDAPTWTFDYGFDPQTGEAVARIHPSRHRLVRVASTGVPAPVKRFIATEIESVEQLEVLLLLRGAADKDWTAKEVARALVTQPESAATWLEKMAGSGILGAQGNSYRYAPPTKTVDETIDRLAESYAKYRVTVIGLIFSKPSERVTLFSDAFRIRRQKD
jgi:hypothetical protein